MANVAILSDSLSCLPLDVAEKHGVFTLPINIKIGTDIFRDSVDLSPTEAYKLFQKDPDSFSTSPPTPGEYLNALREAGKQAGDILCITVSSRLSTVYNVACLAAEQVRAEVPGLNVDVLDSQTVLAAEGFIALAAAREAERGLALAAVLRAAEAVKQRVTFTLALDTVRHVYRTGRVPKVAVQAASVLPVKVILTVSGGVVRPQGVARNMRQGIEHMLGKMACSVGHSPVHVAVMHAYSPEEGEKLKDRIASEFNCAELWMAEVSPVVGYALGTGALGFAYYADQDGASHT